MSPSGRSLRRTSASPWRTNSRNGRVGDCDCAVAHPATLSTSRKNDPRGGGMGEGETARAKVGGRAGFRFRRLRVIFSLAHVLAGEPASTSPEHALAGDDVRDLAQIDVAEGLLVAVVEPDLEIEQAAAAAADLDLARAARLDRRVQRDRIPRIARAGAGRPGRDDRRRRVQVDELESRTSAAAGPFSAPASRSAPSIVAVMVERRVISLSRM
jgi:hypothetical protein